MRKVIVLVALCFLGVSSVNAQRASGLGIGFELAFPQDNFGNDANLGTGASLLFQSPLHKDINFTVSVGYIRFNGDSPFANIRYREGFVPIKAGLRYFITDFIYGSGEAGVSISTADGGGNGVFFAYSPAVGTQIPIGNGAIDAGLRYEGWMKNGSRSIVGLRLGYNF